jgi:hypothetical protein
MVTARLLTHAYGQMGEIAASGGFFSYFVVMQVYGFDYNNIFFLLSVSAVNPVDRATGEIDKTINTWYDFDVTVN